MSNDKDCKSLFSKSTCSYYNEGKYGKLKDDDLNDSLINKRVVSDENFATVKYVGNIPKSNGLWLGVDWDDDTRGRHDGSHGGVKYFDTWAPTSGSFVRPNKVSRGLTIEEAIKIRYGSVDETSNYILDEFFLESSDSDDECGSSRNIIRSNRGQIHQKVKVNISGPATGAFNVHSGKMDKLKSLILHSLPIFRSYSMEEAAKEEVSIGLMVPLVTELDIAQTLLCDWLDLARICEQLPKLTNLNISDNKFISFYPNNLNKNSTECRREIYKKSFKSIQNLVLVRLYFKWSEYYEMFDCFPMLQHLCLAYNKLSLLQPAIHTNFKTLKYIDLACNEIEDFQTCILPFGQLESLETLLLNENKIKDITLPGSIFDESDLFPNLKLLAISNNQIDSWDAVHHFGRVRMLKELIFMFNPILDSQKNPETARQDVIAKMGRLKMLNRNDIKYDERKGAEIDYMKRYGKIWLEAQSTKEDIDKEVIEKKLQILEQFHKDHPRFLKLVELYGAPEHSEVKEVSRKLKERLIEVCFEYYDKSDECRTIKKRIPNQMTVQHLRSLLRRLCKLSAKSEFNLVYVSTSRPNLEIPLDADTREIGFYNVQEGDKVIVQVI